MFSVYLLPNFINIYITRDQNSNPEWWRLVQSAAIIMVRYGGLSTELEITFQGPVLKMRDLIIFHYNGQPENT